MKTFWSSVILLISMTCVAQGPFEKIYNTTYDRALRDLVKMPDGGYMLCGWTNVSDPTESDVFVMRTDINGEVLPGWPRTYGKNGPAKVDFAYSIVATTDGNYFILGYSASYGGGDIDVYLLKIQPDGTEIFTKTYGGFSFDEGREIIKTSDGNYMIVGSTTNGSDQQAFLMKIDNAGNPLWSPAMHLYGSGSKEFGNAVAENTDGSFIFTGQSMANDPRGDTYLVKTDAGGAPAWEKIYGEPFADEGTGIVVKSDGSPVICIRDSTSATDINVRVRHFDNAGLPGAFNKSYGGSSKDTPKCIRNAKDGNYYIGAISRSWNWRGDSDPDSPDMWLLKIDAASGDTMWSRNFGRQHHDHCESVRPDPVQEAILLCGHSVGAPYVKKPYFLKINNDGKLAELGISELELKDNISWYYAPEQNVLHVATNVALNGMTLNVSDIMGRSVLQKKIDLDQSSSTEIRLSDVSSGVYLLQIGNGRTQVGGKFAITAR